MLTGLADRCYVFLMLEELDSSSKNFVSGQFSVHFRWTSRRKKSFLNFKESLWSFFRAKVLISAVMSQLMTIFEDFSSLLPARPVAVKNLNSSNYDFEDSKNCSISAEFVDMVELKPQITEYLTTWTEWSSCSPYCKRSRFRVCSGEFKCYDE